MNDFRRWRFLSPRGRGGASPLVARLCLPGITLALALGGCGDGGMPSRVPMEAVAPAAAATAPTTSAPSAAAPSTSTTLVVTRAGVGLAGAPPLYPLPADRSAGADAAYKRHGPMDLWIVPLAAAFEAERAAGRAREPLIVIADPETPYRVLIEVLFTAGQSGIGRYEVREPPPSTRAMSVTPPPSAGRSRRRACGSVRSSCRAGSS